MNFNPQDVDSLRVDDEGGVFFVCSFISDKPDAKAEGMPEAPEEVLRRAALDVEGTSVPISSPPIRHSRPGASNVLFLDFNGHIITGTVWNSNEDYQGPRESWDCRPYDFDNDETTFSASEQAKIIQIWERVAEDYAPFNVDVTTEQPTVWTSTTGHALITPTTDKNNNKCPHYGYGGVAYVGTFGNGTYSYNTTGEARSPAWCIDYDSANAAEVISHELGHNMGLSHDGTSSQGYYPGHENGSITWGPIMGTGYGVDVSQWSKGEYYDANQSQDDLAIIQGKLGYRVDDHGDNNASASSLGFDASGAVAQSGVIETTGDPDVFSFATGAGEITISASPYRAASQTWGNNLDIILELYDSSGNLLETNNPTLEVKAGITRYVPAGSYFIHVKPTGVGNPMNSSASGYTAYGSLGQYTLSGTVASDADADGIPNQWEIQYFNGFTNAVATADPDGDGSDNYSEYVAGTVPNDADSVFKMTSYSLPSTTGDPVVINWSTKPGRVYSVGHTHDLKYVDFEVFPDAVDLPPTQNTYTDTSEHDGVLHFYRVEVTLEQ
ncbi:zinc-dependent metalloprotease family protein [Pontiellaceae bacterium B12219]|nr:zinc-dependent metalloprotease family protein [Pontiellaceae bacterium B12219]